MAVEDGKDRKFALLEVQRLRLEVKRLTKLRLINTLIIATSLIGFFLRIYFYIINRSLGLDEAGLALNIINRSYLGLLKPLDFSQGAPIGFLLLQKTIISFLGSSDYTLRLTPLLAGLASIPLMYLVSKKYGGRLSAFISLGLFVLSPRLIYYSSDMKQYSTDVLTTLAMLLIAPKCLEGKANSQEFVVLGIAGSLSIWISHPSLFVVASIFLTLSLVLAVHRDSYHLYWLIGIGVAWGISLGLAMLLS